MQELFVSRIVWGALRKLQRSLVVLICLALCTCGQIETDCLQGKCSHSQSTSALGTSPSTGTVKALKVKNVALLGNAYDHDDTSTQAPLFAPENLADWSATRSEMERFQIHYTVVKTMRPNDLRKIAQVLTREEKEVAMITGGLMPGACNQAKKLCEQSYGVPYCDEFFSRVGEFSARLVSEKIEQYENVGGTMHEVIMDGPFTDAAFESKSAPNNKCQFDTATLIEQAALYVKILQDRHPRLKVTIGVNFPNWKYSLADASVTYAYQGPGKGPLKDMDYRRLLINYVQAVESLGATLSDISVDNPYTYATCQQPSPWSDVCDTDRFLRVLDLRDLSRALGLGFNQIFSSGPPQVDCTNISADRCNYLKHQKVQEYVLNFVSFFQRRMLAAGEPANPDVSSFNTWYDEPKATIPENREYTFLDTVLKAFELL